MSLDSAVSKLKRWSLIHFAFIAVVSLTAPTSGVHADVDCPTHLTHYWQFNETSGTVFDDLIATLDAGCSAACPAFGTGIVEGATAFDGSTEIDIPASTDFDFASDASFAIEFWMKSDATCAEDDNQANGVIVGRFDGGASDPLSIWWVGVNCNSSEGPQGAVRFVLKDNGGGPVMVGTTVVNDNEWHHVAAVHDFATSSVHLYVDGSLEATATAVTFASGFAADDNINVGYLNTGTGGFYYTGLLDELALHDVALSDSDIMDHYERGINDGHGYCNETPEITSTAVTVGRAGEEYMYDVEADGYPAPAFALTTAPVGMTIDPVTGLIEWTPDTADDYDVAVEVTNASGTDQQSYTLSILEEIACPDEMSHYWKLDEQTSGPYDDFIGGNDISCTNCPTPLAGIVDGAQQFDGTDDQGDIADDGSFDWGPTESFSVEFWMRKSADCAGTQGSQYNEVIVGRYGTGENPLNIWWIGVNCNQSDGLPGSVRFVLRDSGGQGTMILSDESIVDGEWHHIAVVRDAVTGENLLYIDGELEISTTVAYTTGFSDDAALNIGYLGFGGFYRYEGDLDEVAMYDRALTLGDVTAHYTNGLQGISYCDNVAPVITSIALTEATVGMSYSYDVEASGIPTPTFDLIQAPAGMSIDPTTGVIAWTAEFAGDYDVIVEAANSVGSDEQPFTITVTGAPLCPANLVHYWTFDEADGPNYHDFIGSANATGMNYPVAGTGMVNGCQQFDGTHELDIADHMHFDWTNTSSFTIEFWVKKDTECDGNTNSENNVIIGRKSDGGTGNLDIWWVGLNCNTSTGEQGSVRFVLREKATTGLMIVSSESLIGTGWHHVAAVRNGTTNENMIYVDGELAVSENLAFVDGFDDTVPINLGYIGFAEHFNFDGHLDELAVHDRALDDGEIESHYLSGLSGLGYCYLCGDVDGSAGIDIDDIVYLIAYVFAGGPAPVSEATGDVDCSEGIDIDDIVYLITYVFQGGDAPCAGCTK